MRHATFQDRERSGSVPLSRASAAAAHFAVAEALSGHSVPTYSYAGNNPIAFVDSTGEKRERAKSRLTKSEKEANAKYIAKMYCDRKRLKCRTAKLTPEGDDTICVSCGGPVTNGSLEVNTCRVVDLFQVLEFTDDIPGCW